MKKYNPSTLIALILLLLVSGAVGSARAARLSLQIMPGWELYPGIDEKGVRMGYAVAGAGRVNGDSYPDVLVGADRGGVIKEGWAGLYLGGAAGPQTTPAWEAFGESQGNMFGGALDGAGDVNGDGYNDIIVGASNYGSDLPGEGAAYLYYGTAGGAEFSPGWKVEGNAQGAQFGAAVAGAGDVNGDGYADVIVGMPGYVDVVNGMVGAALVYLGSDDGLQEDNSWIDIGLYNEAYFGKEVNSAGDVNGDGYDDVLVGEPEYDSGEYQNVGAVYLYLGNNTEFGLSNVHAWSYIGYRGGDFLGTSASGVGDLNGDDCDDIAIGAPGFNTGSMLDTGRVYVFYGCQNETVSRLNDTPDWGYSYLKANANTGIDVSGGGDTNGDGYDELVVGAYKLDDEHLNEGAVFAFFGEPGGLAPQPGWMVEGNKNDTEFGFAVDGVGDANGDGFTDVLIGAPIFKVDGAIKGAAFIYFGTLQRTFYHHFLPLLGR